jgi:hypothetical protein
MLHHNDSLYADIIQNISLPSPLFVEPPITSPPILTGPTTPTTTLSLSERPVRKATTGPTALSQSEGPMRKATTGPTTLSAGPTTQILMHTKIKTRKGGFIAVRTKPNGDCLYESISIAFMKKISIQELRNLVSNYQTRDSFTVYKLLSEDENEIKEYEIIKNVETLEEFKHLIRQCGQEYGAKNCLWGDENALHNISNALNVNFVIFDGKGNYLQSITSRDTTEHTPNVLLLLNNLKEGFEHFSLLKYKNMTMFSEIQIQKIIELENVNSASSDSRKAQTFSLHKDEVHKHMTLRSQNKQ